MPPLIVLALMLAMTGCTSSAPLHVEMVRSPVPVVTKACPLPALAPQYPPNIVSVERLRLFAQEADAARIRNAAALRECTLRLRRATDALDALRAGQPIP